MTAPHEIWIAKAQDDLSFARLGLKHGYFSQVCFLSQQAAEKALKAVLIQRTGTHPRVHSLVELSRRCAAYVPGVDEDLTDKARILDQYYTPSRYPDGVPSSSPDGLPQQRHAEEALRIAHEILCFSQEQAAGEAEGREADLSEGSEDDAE